MTTFNLNITNATGTPLNLVGAPGGPLVAAASPIGAGTVGAVQINLAPPPPNGGLAAIAGVHYNNALGDWHLQVAIAPGGGGARVTGTWVPPGGAPTPPVPPHNVVIGPPIPGAGTSITYAVTCN